MSAVQAVFSPHSELANPIATFILPHRAVEDKPRNRLNECFSEFPGTPAPSPAAMTAVQTDAAYDKLQAESSSDDWSVELGDSAVQRARLRQYAPAQQPDACPAQCFSLDPELRL